MSLAGYEANSETVHKGNEVVVCSNSFLACW